MAMYMRDPSISTGAREYVNNSSNMKNSSGYGNSRFQVMQVQPIDCNPGMLAHPIALLRWFHLLMYFILQWLVQITCGNDACTMIMNVFGYTAMGQLFVLLILLLMSIICVSILVAYGLNFHHSKYLPVILSVERLYVILGFVLFIIAAILGTWMAVLTNDDSVNYQGRGKFHIRGQWIAAAVFEFLMIFVFLGELLLQRRENYPFIDKVLREAPPGPQIGVYNVSPSPTRNRTPTKDEYFSRQSMI
ncbi:hypothetical protein KIN20_010987 [Parelaphostrongylus tenuis]|uniref:MARVEL domain-containing protein n=1 Tax=Parelaphostrongylus tenuis TaxID=148309 RepID=A0AAD5MU96_PARTN|nr:hypothetical protein KIN20_010987 [Parelaphostrongylus tenuis]